MAPPKKPVTELGEPSTLVFVGGIPGLATEKEFLDYFASFGNLCVHEFPLHDLKPCRNRGFAFLEYKTINDAMRVVFWPTHVLRSKQVPSKARRSFR